MTKKHFIALADDIRYNNKRRLDAGLPPMFDLPAIEELADFCKRQNHGFNRERWLGYIAGKNGPNGGSIK